jgi:succinyl-CoA synthetase beta subunit
LKFCNDKERKAHEYSRVSGQRAVGALWSTGFKGQNRLYAREAQAAADLLGGKVCVVKAQVHAGGRGKAGGVKLAKNSMEAYQHAEKILGMTLVTPQTGAKGKLVRKVYVEAGCNIASEFYLSMLVDRARKCITIIASTAGGTGD